MLRGFFLLIRALGLLGKWSSFCFSSAVCWTQGHTGLLLAAYTAGSSFLIFRPSGFFAQLALWIIGLLAVGAFLAVISVPVAAVLKYPKVGVLAAFYPLSEGARRTAVIAFVSALVSLDLVTPLWWGFHVPRDIVLAIAPWVFGGLSFAFAQRIDVETARSIVEEAYQTWSGWKAAA